MLKYFVKFLAACLQISPLSLSSSYIPCFCGEDRCMLKDKKGLNTNNCVNYGIKYFILSFKY